MEMCCNGALVMPSSYAVMYYASPIVLGGYAAIICPTLGLVGVGAVLTCLYWIRSHANPVDIGGDSKFRVSVYNAIWKYL